MAASKIKDVELTQDPSPGANRVLYCGDLLRFSLTVRGDATGQAFIRTNLGAAGITRKEIIAQVEKNEIRLDAAWFDFEMAGVSGNAPDAVRFEILLPVCETGFFQAKCFFLPEGSTDPVWPQGENTILNVQPAGTLCANIIYNGFVRQFGPFKHHSRLPEETAAMIESLDEKGYTVIPESGKFRDLAKEVPFIFSELGCRVLHLLPVHPTPTTYARMGRFGSPYAALNFTEVDPALADFDPSATPLEQFMELVDTVHQYSGYLIMDIAINHTGWAAAIHESHPEWLVRGEDGKIDTPGAWGVVWADLTKLDYSNKKLWTYMADVFLLWCHRGVDGFRCDAGYMIPVAAWEYIVAKVREKYPDTLFFLEGLGGPVSVTREILGRAGFNWAYSELFQNYTREEITNYLPQVIDISETGGHLIHFAETHDNNRLASVSTVYARMRTALCALFSVCGGFGFANGVEWFADKKINVHESPDLNWGSAENQVQHIRRLNLILKYHPAFSSGARMQLIQNGKAETLVLLRESFPPVSRVLVLVNLDCDRAQEAAWRSQDAGENGELFYDLLNAQPVSVSKTKAQCRVMLDPGQVRCLSPDLADLDLIDGGGRLPDGMPETVLMQKYRAQVLKIHTVFQKFGALGNLDIEPLSRAFAENPLELIRSMNPDSEESCVTVFDIEKDLHRQVMVPPENFLLVISGSGFRAELIEDADNRKTSMGCEEALPGAGQNSFFALFVPLERRKRHLDIQLNLRIFEPSGPRAETADLRYLAPFDTLVMRSAFTRREIYTSPFLKLLCTTDRGGMMRAAAWWGRLDSRYDGLLCANLNPDIPENRWMALARCRIWAIFQGYSRELDLDCLEAFWFSYDHGGKWRFHVPTSEGNYFAIELFAFLHPRENHMRLLVRRVKSGKQDKKMLEDEKPVQLILRPDIEDRSFHDTVKAYLGPEHQWPEQVSCFENGFDFSMSREATLRLSLSRGQFFHEPEWTYMVERPLEAQRGLDAASDLYSPGYFSVSCRGGNAVRLDAGVRENRRKNIKIRFPRPRLSFKTNWSLKEAVKSGLDAFYVGRGKDASVIAGYPWFLDWGRDSLIYCRAMIQTGQLEKAAAILRQFGRFESGGTLPNMICGDDAANIETSDAPLWFFTCCKEMVEKQGNLEFLDQDLDGRTVKDVLLSIAHHLMRGTRTGVVMDPASGLIYSPAHFTWMDTNFPAGTPRRGYPVEIQALWYHALMFLSKIDDAPQWKECAQMVKDAVDRLFWKEAEGFYSDCLHSDGPGFAPHAAADDALRPNQLLLVTMDCAASHLKARRCVETCQELLVPGGIRSLSSRKVRHPLEIIHHGVCLNDRHDPYSGRYEGDEDTRRKPAYHNGTAWTWPFPIFCEAWAQVFGPKSHARCLAWLGSVTGLMRSGAAGFIPEILDGDFPHAPRGCDAQAWGVSEVIRVMDKLDT